MAQILISCSTLCIPNLNRAQAPQVISDAGFKHVEAYSTETESKMHPDVVFADTVIEDLQQHGLKLSGLNISAITVGCDLTGIKEEIEYAASLGLDTVNIKGGHRTDRELNALVNCLKVLAPFAKMHNIAINVRNHHATRIENMQDIEAVLSTADPTIGLAMNAGEMHTAKVDPVDVIEKFLERIRVVYIRDQANHRIVPLGKGEIDIPRIIDTLYARSFKGFIVVEMELKNKKIEKCIAEARDYLDAILGQHVK